MFQGGGTNLKHWNYHTKSKFLDRLKQLGKVYIYQDKLYNIWHYNKTDPEHLNYDSDIDFDLSYINPDTHIKMIYADIMKKYSNYKFIPIGYSAGALFALYFAQQYKKQCIHIILLDPALWTPANIKRRLSNIKKPDMGNKPITNNILKKKLEKWKVNQTNMRDMYLIADECQYKRSLFFSKYLNIKLEVPTMAFIDIDENENPIVKNKTFNNKYKILEYKTLKKYNKDTYNFVILKNATHFIYNKIKNANVILKYIKFIINELSN